MRKFMSLLLCILVITCSVSGLAEMDTKAPVANEESTAHELSITFSATEEFDDLIKAPISGFLNRLSISSLLSEEGIHTDLFIDNEHLVYMDMAYSGAFPFIRSNLFDDMGVSLSDEEFYALLQYLWKFNHIIPVNADEVYCFLSPCLYPDYIDEDSDESTMDLAELTRRIVSDFCSLGETVDCHDEESALYDSAVKAYEIHTNGMDFLSMMENYNGALSFSVPSDAIWFFLTSNHIDAKVYLDDTGYPVKIQGTVTNEETPDNGKTELNLYYSRLSGSMEDGSARHLTIVQVDCFLNDESLPFMTSQFTLNATTEQSNLTNVYGSVRVTSKNDTASNSLTSDTEDYPVRSACFDYVPAEASADSTTHMQILYDCYSDDLDNSHIYYDYTYAHHTTDGSAEADLSASIDNTIVCNAHMDSSVSKKQYDFRVDDMITCYDLSWVNIEDVFRQEEFKDAQDSVFQKLTSSFPELATIFQGSMNQEMQ